MASQSKQCSRCKAVKPVDEFHHHRRDGRVPQCKSCRRETRFPKAAQRKKLLAKGMKRCPACKAEKQLDEFYHQASKKDGRMTYCKSCRTKHPQKYSARNAVNIAVLSGKLPPIRTLACVKCGDQATERHHHLGYDKEHWLDVVPLCRKCHISEHQNL